MFNRNNDILALDFDGVIADSIHECLVVGHNSFSAFEGDNKRIDALRVLDEEHVVESKRLRNFIRSGEDYVYINLALKQKQNIQNQADFDDFTARHAALRPKFYDVFYRERERLSTENRDGWVKLNPLYKGMKAFLKKYDPKRNLFIITTKKTSFVKIILTANGIDIPDQNLFHADSESPKKMIISNLLLSNHVNPKHFYFVDDQVDTLLKVKATAVHCIFAEWGYNNAEQKKKALDAGIECMTLDEFYFYFKGI